MIAFAIMWVRPPQGQLKIEYAYFCKYNNATIGVYCSVIWIIYRKN